MLESQQFLVIDADPENSQVLDAESGRLLGCIRRRATTRWEWLWPTSWRVARWEAVEPPDDALVFVIHRHAVRGLQADVLDSLDQCLGSVESLSERASEGVLRDANGRLLAQTFSDGSEGYRVVGDERLVARVHRSDEGWLLTVTDDAADLPWLKMLLLAAVVLSGPSQRGSVNRRLDRLSHS